MTTANAGARIALAAITPSTTNPRKRFDKAALDELADSIKRHDVLQPILLRPNGGPDKFEVVAGERRYRAAKAAGLVDIPATVRVLTDAEVLEIQVIENLQREDLHELEEAEGYERLLKCAHHDGTKFTVDEIAAKVGKSRSYVFARLKLCALCPEARKAFFADEIDASKALLVARIGHHDTQRQALKDIQQGFHQDGPMSYREAHQHILRTYMLQLKEAPFDIKDEKLVAKAGACGPCPKRTGNQADLFGDVKSADVCTDPKCFDDKRQAHYGVAVRELQAKGKKVIAGAAAKKAFPDWDSGNGWARDRLQGGYIKLEDTSYASGRGRKVSEILGPDFEPVLLQHPGTGQIVKAATQQAVTAAANKASRKRDAGGKKHKASGPRERARSKEEVFHERLFLELAKKLPTQLGKVELADVARDMLINGGSTLVAAALFPAQQQGKKPAWDATRKRIDAEISKQDVAGLSRIVYGLLLAREAEDNYGRPTLLLAVAKRWKVDPAKVKKAIADEARIAAVVEKVKKGAKKGKVAKTVQTVRPMAPNVTPVITPLIKPMDMEAVDSLLEKRAKTKVKAKKAAARKPRPLADFMKPMKPSAALAAIVGDKPMPRTEVTSKLWGYIKKHKLQDEKNRRMINTDEPLRAVMAGKKQVSMFEMTKYVAKQLTRA